MCVTSSVQSLFGVSVAVDKCLLNQIEGTVRRDDRKAMFEARYDSMFQIAGAMGRNMISESLFERPKRQTGSCIKPRKQKRGVRNGDGV